MVIILFIFREKLDGCMYPPEQSYVPIKQLVENRNKNRKITAKAKVDFKYVGQDKRESCWIIDKRGAVGETIIHLCCLNNENVHMELMKEVINLYPNLCKIQNYFYVCFMFTAHFAVKDIYLSDEYYGETPLHMTIANEDVHMVEFILSKAEEVPLIKPKFV